MRPEHFSWSIFSLSRLSLGWWSFCLTGVDEPAEVMDEVDRLDGSLGGPAGSDARGPLCGDGDVAGEGDPEGGPRQLPRLMDRTYKKARASSVNRKSDGLTMLMDGGMSRRARAVPSASLSWNDLRRA